MLLITSRLMIPAGNFDFFVNIWFRVKQKVTDNRYWDFSLWLCAKMYQLLMMGLNGPYTIWCKKKNKPNIIWHLLQRIKSVLNSSMLNYCKNMISYKTLNEYLFFQPIYQCFVVFSDFFINMIYRKVQSVNPSCQW